MYSRAEGGTGEEEEQGRRSCLGEDSVVRQGLIVVGLGISLVWCILGVLNKFDVLGEFLGLFTCS